MPSNKEYNVKINRLKNTRKMTRTMKLVSMSKLIKAQEAQRRAKLYENRLKDLISRLAATLNVSAHPLLQSNTKAKKALVFLITSDRGLAGGFNNNLIRFVNNWANQNKTTYEKIDFSFAGRRGFTFFKSRFDVKNNYIGMTARPDFTNARKIGEELSQIFLSGEYTEVFIAYNRFNSPLSQTPIIEKLLPIETKPLLYPNEKIPSDYIYEPKAEEVISFIIPKYLFFTIYYLLLENSAGEHGARMTAMESATKNAEELIGSLTLQRNRARQAAITGELMEIIAGAEALNH